MKVILNVIENLTEETKKGSGKFKVIKKGIISRLSVDTEDFLTREIYDAKGRVCKNKVLIVHSKLGELIVKHKFDDIITMVDRGEKQFRDRVIIKGFRRDLNEKRKK